MANLDLHPLSLGEILDRSFLLYRRNFVLFLGIAAIPQLFVLALNLAQVSLGISRNPVQPGRPVASPNLPPAAAPAIILIGLIGIVVYLVTYLLAQGATVSAVSELYLGRSTTIGESLRKSRAELGVLFGVSMLNGLVTLIGFVLLIIPGVYLACRLLIAVPAAMIENLGPRESLERSFALTKGSAGRSFMILVVYFIILIALMSLLTGPIGVASAATRGNPELARLWALLMPVSQSVVTVIVTPILLIALSVFYFDLRVRKEAFDLQMMLNPSSSAAAGAQGAVL